MLCYHWIFTLLSYFILLFSSTLSFSITGDVILDLDSTTQTNFANDVALWSSDSSVSPLYTNCSGTWILGGYGVLSSTQQLSRTYSGLPTHTSAQVIINFWFIDVWTSTNSISVDILDGATTVLTKSLKVTTSNWPSNLCGDSSTKDLAPVTISSTVSHAGDFGLKIMCSAAANSPISGYCGLRDIRVTLSTTTTTSGTFCAYATDIANIDATTLSCTCPTGKYFNTSTGACETCDSACTACSGPTKSECSSCASGYTFDGVDTCYTCVTGCLVCTGGAPTDCLSCAPGNYYMYPNSSCLLGCSTPYTSNSSGYCNFPCTAPNYLFTVNFSCDPYCNDPYKKRQEGLELSCDLPCASNAYYYPNGSCSTSCTDPMVKDTSNNMKFCESPCSDSTMYYYASENTCHAGCSGTVTSETFYQTCTPSDSTGSSGSDDPQSKGTLQVLKETTDSVLNAGLIIASLASMGDSFSIIDGTMSRMFQYVRYLDIGYSAELEMVLISWSNGLFSVTFPSDPPNSLNDTAVYKPLPNVFSKYGLAPSFLYNYWQEWLMSVVFFGVFLCLVGLEYGVKRLKPKNPIFRTIAYYLRVMSAQFVLMVTYTSFGDMLFFAILEYRMTIPGRNISNLSLTISVIQLLVCIAILALQIKLTADKQRIIGNKSTRPNTEALKGFAKKYPGCQVFWHDFKDGSLSQQGFLLIFIGRTFLMMVILASLDTHPLVECVIIVIMNILMIMFLVWKRPFKERFNEIQQLFSEVCLLFVNISCLSMAALDAQDREASTTRKNLGYFIIILNTIFNFASLVFLVFMGYVIGKHFYHERKEAKLKRSQTKAQSAAQQDQNEQLSLASADQDASSAVRLKRKTTRLELTETFDKTKKESKYPETSQDLNLHISLEGPTMLTRGKSFVDLCVEDGKDTEREFQTSGAASAYRTHKSRTLRANQIKQDLKKGSPEPGKESMRSLMNTWKESLVSAETDRSPSPEIRRTQTLAEKLESTTRSKYTDPEPSPFEYARPLLQHSNTTEVLVKESKTEESPTRMNGRPKSRPIQLSKQTIVAYVSPTHVNKGTISIVNMKEVPKESVLIYGSVKPKIISSEKEQSLAMASELEKKLTMKSQESIKAKKERSLVNESNNSQNLSQSSSQNLGQLSKKSTSKFDKLDNDDVTTTKPNSK